MGQRQERCSCTMVMVKIQRQDRKIISSTLYLWKAEQEPSAIPHNKAGNRYAITSRIVCKNDQRRDNLYDSEDCNGRYRRRETLKPFECTE